MSRGSDFADYLATGGGSTPLTCQTAGCGRRGYVVDDAGAIRCRNCWGFAHSTPGCGLVEWLKATRIVTRVRNYFMRQEPRRG